MSVTLHDARPNGGLIQPRMERKFYLPPPKIDQAYGLLQHICRRDAEYPSEQINSLYFDTSGLEEHHNSLDGALHKNKVRLRWYGRDEELHGLQTAFLELKSRQGFASTKQRYQIQVRAEELRGRRPSTGIISRSLLQDILAGFGYFPEKPLQPVIRISYWRHRFCDLLSGQRIALDSRIRSSLFMPGIGCDEREVSLEGAVIEIKGRKLELPLILRQMKLLDLDWSRFSKYSACLESQAETPLKPERGWPSGINLNF